MGKSTGLVRIWYQTIKKRVKRKPWMTPKVVLLLLLTNMCADAVQSTCELKDDQEACDHYFSHYPTSCEDDKDFTSKYCSFTCSGLDECVKLKPKCTIEQIANATPNPKGQIHQGETVTYECKEGFFPKEGDAVRGCQRDGTLTGRKLLCKAPNNCIEKRFGTRTWYKTVWYRFTNISTVIQSVVVKEELDRPCQFNDFGFSGLGLWVTSCKAIFTVCFEEEIKSCQENEKCIPKPQDDSPPGNVKQCLHKKLYCDSAYNCDDGMDENNCVCPKQCTDKEKPDCMDGSDEDPEFCWSEFRKTIPSRLICTMGKVAESTKGDLNSWIIPDEKKSPNNIEDCRKMCMANLKCGGTAFGFQKCHFYTKDVKTKSYVDFVFSKKYCQDETADCKMGNVVENTRGYSEYMIDLSPNNIEDCRKMCMANKECEATAFGDNSCIFYTNETKPETDEDFVFSKKYCYETECTEYHHMYLRRTHPRKKICMHASKYCDGTGNRWDIEENCRGSKCPLDYKKCADDLQCLHEDKFCDGIVDCNDRSDEQCEGQGCKYGAHKCSDDKQCLYQDKFCDGNIDCEDESDELYCGDRVSEVSAGASTSARALHIALVMVVAAAIF